MGAAQAATAPMPHHVSQVNYEKLNKSFFELLGSYRIEEAKKLLSEKSTHKNVMEILYEVGFNSKSSFNTAFKKYTLKTPSEFRKSGDES